VTEQVAFFPDLDFSALLHRHAASCRRGERARVCKQRVDAKINRGIARPTLICFVHFSHFSPGRLYSYGNCRFWSCFARDTPMKLFLAQHPLGAPNGKRRWKWCYTRCPSLSPDLDPVEIVWSNSGSLTCVPSQDAAEPPSNFSLNIFFSQSSVFSYLTNFPSFDIFVFINFFNTI
jgi:hypothetical protein